LKIDICMGINIFYTCMLTGASTSIIVSVSVDNCTRYTVI